MKYLILIFPILMIHSAIAGDKYQSFSDLAQFEKENEDFKIIVENKKSPTTLLAIHGGKIEPGTSELLEATQLNFNTYIFAGIKNNNNFDLHLTSSRFDEPRALELVKSSKNCLSFHSYIGKGERAAFCIGGKNKAFAQKIKEALTQLGDSVEIIYPCAAFPGEHENNIVNKCENGGVQLEMNIPLCDRIVSDQAFRKQVADILRSKIQDME